MKGNIFVKSGEHSIELVTNSATEFDNMVICFHGFNGGKYCSTYNELKHRLTKSLVASFDSCGHGESEISSEDMRLNTILQEIDDVVKYFQRKFPNKPVILVAMSYGAYRVMNYLIKFKPNISKVVYINPGFRMLTILENIRQFKYSELKENDKIVMKAELNKFIKKPFIDDLYNNNLYAKTYDINYNTQIVIGTRDSLIPVEDTLEIAEMYNYPITRIDEEHSFEDKGNYQIVANIIEKQ